MVLYVVVAVAFLTLFFILKLIPDEDNPEAKKVWTDLHHGGSTHDEMERNYLEGTQYKGKFLPMFNFKTWEWNKGSGENPKMAGGVSDKDLKYSKKTIEKFEELS